MATKKAKKLAEILIPHGIDCKGHQSRLKTAYGKLTRENLADLIDGETAVPELLEALKDIIKAYDLNMGPSAVRLRLELGRDAIARAEGEI